MRPHALVSLLALWAPVHQAAAGELVEGDVLRVYYGDIGVWNDAEESRGLQVKHGGSWVDYTWPGTPFAAFLVEWEDGGSAPESYYATSNGFKTNLDVDGARASSADGWLSMVNDYTAGDLALRKTETWAVGEAAMLVHLRAANTGARQLDDLRLLFAVDPDQDNSLGTTNTVNEGIDLDDDEVADVILAAGPVSGHTLVIGACDRAEVGTFASWQGAFDVDVDLVVPQAEVADTALGIRLEGPAGLDAGESVGLSFLVAAGDTSTDALDAMRGLRDLCTTCDVDGDGWLASTCGGDDCDDTEAAAFPGGVEVWYDGVDGDCDGQSDYDADGDGYDSDAHGGDDCDDSDESVHPGAADVPYDGRDDDCSGGNDYDADGDGYVSAGHGGEDCDDANPDVHPGVVDVEGDGLDLDCDGRDGSADDVNLTGGCGCAGVGPTSGPWWLALVGLVALRRRSASS